MGNRLFGKENRIPVGRTRSLCVFPFSFSEFLRCLGHLELAEISPQWVLSHESGIPSRSRS